MTIRVGINGFGRIGRLVLRGITETRRSDYVVVAINDLGLAETNAHLLRHDTVHGPFPGEVKLAGQILDAGNGPIKVLSEKDPSCLGENLASTLSSNVRGNSAHSLKQRSTSAPELAVSWSHRSPKMPIWWQSME